MNIANNIDYINCISGDEIGCIGVSILSNKGDVEIIRFEWDNISTNESKAISDAIAFNNKHIKESAF